MTEDKKLVAQSANLPTEVDNSTNDLISDEAILGIYGEILNNFRQDRESAAGLQAEFEDLVINGGDATTSSKEALVNLFKARMEASNNMTRIADLMTRIKLKEKNTMQDWQKSKANNTINIIDSGGLNRRALLDEIEKTKKETNE